MRDERHIWRLTARVKCWPRDFISAGAGKVCFSRKFVFKDNKVLSMRTMMIAMLAATFLSACANMKFPDFSSSSNEEARHALLDLKNGIKSYENGDYIEAMDWLKDSIRDGLENKQDQVTAHKYLAFIHCSSAHESLCRSEFRKAFEIDPTFRLGPAEDGNPIWTPVYLDIKREFFESKPYYK